MTTKRREHQTIRPLLIGVGNAYRRDDAVGLIATRALRPVIGAACTIREESGEGATLMEAWSDAEVVVLLDAAKSGAPPGTIVRLDAGAGPLPAHFFHYSTHAFGVAEAIELARTLGRLPGRLVVFGVEGADFTAGEELSPPVARAVPQLVDAVLDELRVLGVLT